MKPEQDVDAPMWDNEHQESHFEDIKSTQEHGETLLDPHGFPLRPQPSSDPLDPLNWAAWFKMIVLLQVSFLAFLGPFSQGAINAAFEPLAEYMGISITEASYNTTLAIVTAGVAPLLWSPVSNVYGRRPIYLFVSVIGIAAGAGSAVATSWGPLLVARIFVGIGTSPGMGIGASVVADMYYMHERGRFMGLYIVFVTNGAHLAAVVGGFTAKYVGWRWCYWVPCIALGVTWVINLFLLPETLYRRDPRTAVSLEPLRTRKQLLAIYRRPTGRRLRFEDFGHALYMAKYPSVCLTGIYYSYAFGIGTVLFAVTGSAAFGALYGFDSAQVGMCIGLSTTAGSIIGEFAAGPVSDLLLLTSTKRNKGISTPEARLHAMWPGLVILPAGVIIEGVCLQYHTHWSGPVLGIGIGAFGLQIVSTNIFAYLADCYRPQSAEISTLLNFGRLTFSFTLAFYMTPFALATSYGTAWSVMACISVVLYAGIIALLWRGKYWRDKLGEPNFDRTL